MEILFAGIYALVIGIAASFLSRPAETMGRAFIPGLATATGLAYWAVATWLLKVPAFAWLAYDRGWIWGILVVLVAAVAISMALTLPRKRAAADRELLDRLSHAGPSVLHS